METIHSALWRVVSSNNAMPMLKFYYITYHLVYTESHSPSSRTISGSLRSKALAAFTIPLATVAQFTIPPNIFTSRAFTCHQISYDEGHT